MQTPICTSKQIFASVSVAKLAIDIAADRVQGCGFLQTSSYPILGSQDILLFCQWCSHAQKGV